MGFTAGIDVGSTYTKAAIMSEDRRVVGKAMLGTGFALAEAAAAAYRKALAEAGLTESDVAYVVSTGYGRYQVAFRDVQVTDLTAQARGACYFFPATRTVLDVGGQTMKASRLDQMGKVRSFRLNDKCAAGTGAFLEKTARYLGYQIERLGPLIETSEKPVTISSVCAVFAESEVINHVSEGQTAADIMHGSIVSLVDRSVQLMKRVQMEPEYTLVGGILRFVTMANAMRERLKKDVNVPPDDLAQYTAAIGAAILGLRRLEKLRADGAARNTPTSALAAPTD
jgi:(R)-2-hydroxyacyl-CoA dehydratese activating ATPase